MTQSPTNTVWTKYYRRLLRQVPRRSQKRFIRYSVLLANFVLLVAVLFFVLGSSQSSADIHQNALAEASTGTVTNPLDQLSSADIAVQVARMTNIYEAVSVTNNADSINAQLATTPSDSAIVAKPQVVSTALKSIRDLQKYTTVSGDTVGSLAAKFGVTSDTIRWSNGITGDALPVGKQLLIPPVNGIAYTAVAGDTADTLAQKFRSNKDVIVAFNDAEVTGIKPGTVVVIPDGTKAAPVARIASAAVGSYYSGFAWGGSAVYGNNGYDYGYCTWYVSNRRAELGRPVPSNLGNAYSWYRVAMSAGLPTGSVPMVGAVAVNQGGNHVMVVEAVNGDGSFWISEMNSHGQVSMTDSTPAGGWGRRDYKLIGSVGSLKFIY